MISRLKKVLEQYEVDVTVKLVIITGEGKAFCSGGDIVRDAQLLLEGHWSVLVNMYKENLLLDYLAATYKKPLVMLIDGVVMGAGAGLSMNASFRVVTENTVLSSLFQPLF
ncbi:3-hydroxyisobutyryl-CoA hydrolase [Handroanthus impetiginosus]|uniref:3-hydroxyisobutyryl-CoA hydrolase n=1 Tax=Handroanthus impetiginosus TaxID=429701 RepID=A0A2G9HDS6_9LAMI|nr:3-hydroxyisobutyryl-CoA hydrolase [Handroanthus impetiginosus]